MAKLLNRDHPLNQKALKGSKGSNGTNSNNNEEPVPLFKVGECAVHITGENVVILGVKTYCNCCDRFLPEAKYRVKRENGEVVHNLPETYLWLPEEE